MGKEMFQRQLESLRQRKLSLKTAHQNKINYLRKQIQTENESYARQVQNIATQEQRLITAKRNCSN